MKNAYMRMSSSIYSLLSSFPSSSAFYLQPIDFSSFFPFPLLSAPKSYLHGGCGASLGLTKAWD